MASYYYFREYYPELRFSSVLIIIICIFAFFIACIFIGIYEMCIDTIFIAFCEDAERNNPPDNPYYMSPNLLRFMAKSERAAQQRAERQYEEAKAKAKAAKKRKVLQRRKALSKLADALQI